MTLPRIARPGRRGPAAAILVVLALVAGCGGGPASPAAPGTAAPTVAPTTALPSGEPAPSEEPTAEPEATEEPTEEPTGEPEPTATPLPTSRPTSSPGPAEACTGNAENRAFYLAVAEQVAWDVYCPVLPAGWFVDAGNFRLAGGGRMEIAYKGPGGARLEIREGAYCGGGAACVPTGPDAGSAAFGDRPARLFDVGDGRWLVAAESGDILWEVRSSGLDGETTTAYAADFALVGR